ncbi:hypothetical protein M407DRAFT_162792 [Tulasnella calospora MUT 4182]|uniref:Uncharacterized protein n=1 Tax=Tulasnella calospora MUT 4182 TaxID=1051891 RepID=A0A0C3Q4D5_9AGAM|nr:hypothetical protein M407DRAFT_162792 [Tulasnella calospora MUT 4182]
MNCSLPQSMHRSSGPSRLQSHHKHHSSSPLKPTTFDTHDKKIGSSRVFWGRNEKIPLTDLVAHTHQGNHSPFGAKTYDGDGQRRDSSMYQIITPGFTVLDNVCSLNGTLDIVRPDTKQGSFPEASLVEGITGVTGPLNHPVRIHPTTYLNLADFITPYIPTPRRRDLPNLHQYILQTGSPSTELEFQGDWVNRAETFQRLNSRPRCRTRQRRHE